MMETLASFNSLAIERVQFVDLCPENWKCDQCGNLAKNIIKTIPTYRIDDKSFQGISDTNRHESTGKCPHKFCIGCFENLMIDNRSVKCPIDSLIIPRRAFNEERLDADTILSKEVYCIHRAHGCRKKCPLSDIEVHLKSCIYGLISCPLKCGQGIIIKKLAHHMASECPRRITNCQYCDEDIVIGEKKDHESNCIKRPVLCTYCKRKTLFIDLRKHFEVCPIKPRNCRLTVIGCDFVGVKEEIEKHESEWKNHVEQFAKFMGTKNGNYSDDLKSRLGDFSSEIKCLTEENISMSRTLNRLSIHMENMMRENSSIKQQMMKIEMDSKSRIEKMTREQKMLVDELQRLKRSIIDEAPV
ncbi:TNF receptor-associated factor 6-like [Brevipalpus obovatus]|uniref:TNF receptor-associated factor 6-like n=1 Tax=Brevipalpus obovatus TaxID=246614 RepID=UPI003D9E5359